MKASLISHALLLFIFFSTISEANECGPWFDNLTSPVCTNAKYIFWAGTMITAGLRITKGEVVDDIQNQAVQKNHLQSWGEVGGDIGFGYFNGAYVLGQFMFGGRNGNKRAEHMMESSFYAFATTHAIKYSIHETRPGYPNEHESFPSGHASFSFAFASVVTAQHGWFWGALAHMSAIFISFSRINDNWHYLHDVVFGMTLGLSYGWGVYYNHKDHQKPYWLGFVPIDNMRGAALAFNYRF